MDINTLRAFFMWCTIINGALLVFSSLFCTFAGDWVYRVHSKWYPIPKETFYVAIYCFVGLYKIIFFVFNLVPYLAALIVGA
jgi:hypothetical protein